MDLADTIKSTENKYTDILEEYFINLFMASGYLRIPVSDMARWDVINY